MPLIQYRNIVDICRLSIILSRKLARIERSSLRAMCSALGGLEASM